LVVVGDPIRLNFLEASQQLSFLQGRFVSPMPNPHPGGPGLCIYIPPEAGCPSYIPRHRVPILVASYDTHWPHWGYSYFPATTQEVLTVYWY
jgi:hypothetical protein